MARWDEKAGKIVPVARTVDEVRGAWAPYFKLHDEVRELLNPDAPMLYSAEHKRGRTTTVDVTFVGPDTVVGTFDEGDRQGEVILGLGHMMARAPEDVRFLFAALDAARPPVAREPSAGETPLETARRLMALADAATDGPWVVAGLLGEETPDAEGFERVRADWSPRASAIYDELVVGAPVAIAGSQGLFICRGMTGPTRAPNAAFLAACRDNVPVVCEALIDALVENDALRVELAASRLVGENLRDALTDLHTEALSVESHYGVDDDNLSFAVGAANDALNYVPAGQIDRSEGASAAVDALRKIAGGAENPAEIARLALAGVDKPLSLELVRVEGLVSTARAGMSGQPWPTESRSALRAEAACAIAKLELLGPETLAPKGGAS
jgi:hypothetical protein